MEVGYEKLLKTWESDLWIICHSHYEAAGIAAKKNYRLGVPTIIISAIVGTAIFSTLESSPGTYIKIITGLLSISAVVLSSLQTFLNWSEKAEIHREAGAKFGSLLKELEQKKAFLQNQDDIEKWTESFRKRWDNLSLESPSIPKKIFDNRIASVKKRRDET